jgi:hypothetical protein
VRQLRVIAVDTVLVVKGGSRLRAREAVLDAIFGSRLRRPYSRASVTCQALA